MGRGHGRQAWPARSPSLCTGGPRPAGLGVGLWSHPHAGLGISVTLGLVSLPRADVPVGAERTALKCGRGCCPSWRTFAGWPVWKWGSGERPAVAGALGGTALGGQPA